MLGAIEKTVYKVVKNYLRGVRLFFHLKPTDENLESHFHSSLAGSLQENT